MFRDDYFDFTDSKPNNVAKECDNKGNGPAAKNLDMVTSMPLMMLILALKFWSSK